MKCKKTRQLLISFLEESLSEKERALVETHLGTCAECTQEKHLLEETWRLLGEVSTPEVSSNFTAQVMKKVHAQTPPRPNAGVTVPAFDFQIGLHVLVPAMLIIVVMATTYIVVHSSVTRKAVESNETISEFQEERPVVTAKQAEAFIEGPDEEIIRYLEIYENIELYQEYGLYDDFDVVQNFETKVV